MVAIGVHNYDVISDVGMEAPDWLNYFILLGLYVATLYAQKSEKKTIKPYFQIKSLFQKGNFVSCFLLDNLLYAAVTFQPQAKLIFS